MNVSTLSIQKTQIDKGALADKGLSVNLARTIKASLTDEEKAVISGYLVRVCEPLIARIVAGAKVSSVSDCAQVDEEEKREALTAGILRNIAEFDLCSGSGFTAVLLESLKTDERFEGCFPTGSDTVATPSNTTTVLDLSDLG